VKKKTQAEAEAVKREDADAKAKKAQEAADIGLADANALYKKAMDARLRITNTWDEQGKLSFIQETASFTDEPNQSP
jgi:hypothetical protein